MLRGAKKEGDVVRVFYNPKNPAENCAARKGFMGGLALISFGQLFLALAIKLFRNLAG